MWTRIRHRWPLIAAGVAVVVVLAIAAVFFTGNGQRLFPFLSDTQSVDNLDIGEGIRVSGEKVPHDIRAQADEAAVPPPFTSPDGLEPLAPIREIRPSGKLEGTMTVMYPLDEAVPADVAVSDIVIAHNRTRLPDGWELLPTRVALSEDRTFVEFDVDHLSWYQPFVGHIKGMANELNEMFLKEMTSNVFAHAKEPECRDEDKALADGYAISSSGQDALYWCFGIENGQRVLRAVNRRSYPLSVELAGLTIKTLGTPGYDLADLAQFAGPIIMPGNEAVFEIDLQPGAKATLNTSTNKSALALKMQLTVLDALLLVATKFKMHAAIDKARAVNDMLAKTKCLGAMAEGNPGWIIKDCFDVEFLNKFFGWRSTILIPVMAAFALIDQSRSFGNALGDALNGRAKYQVTISRSNVPAEYVDSWSRYGSGLVYTLQIFADGTARLKTECAEWNCVGLVSDFKSTVETAPDGRGVITTLTDVWYHNPDLAANPSAARVGSTSRWVLDEHHRLHSEAIDDEHRVGSIFCSTKTPSSQRKPCSDY